MGCAHFEISGRVFQCNAPAYLEAPGIGAQGGFSRLLIARPQHDHVSARQPIIAV